MFKKYKWVCRETNQKKRMNGSWPNASTGKLVLKSCVMQYEYMIMFFFKKKFGYLREVDIKTDLDDACEDRTNLLCYLSHLAWPLFISFLRVWFPFSCLFRQTLSNSILELSSLIIKSETHYIPIVFFVSVKHTKTC